MNNENLDFLDLDDGASMDSLPDAAPFVNPRPKKPWLLLGLGLLVIILATYIIVRTVGGESSSSIEVDLDAPAVVVDGANVATPPVVQPAQPTQPAQPVMPAQPVVVAPQPAQPVVEVPVQTSPVRVIEDRKEVVFKPSAEPAKPAAKPVAKSVAKPVAKPVAKKTAAAQKSEWYVQLGSHSTRALAESAQRQMLAQHPAIFTGHQFVILAAQMKDGTTKYRLRVGFPTSTAANGFCQNAKSDGLDCYVTK